MDWIYKAVLTAVSVAAVLMAARLMGHRVAGLLAGLPVITVPTLLWVTQEQGLGFAVGTAVGSAAASVMAPPFVYSLWFLARRFGAAAGLAGAALVAGLAVSLLQALQGQPGAALLACAVSCAGVKGLLSRASRAGPGAQGTVDAAARASPASAPRAQAFEPWLTAALAGVVSASVALLALRVGPYWSGVLASLPLIAAFALVHLHQRSGAAAGPRFVSGYLVGVFAKALFVCCFAWVAPRWGAAPAWALALLSGAVAATLLSRGRMGTAAARGVVAQAVRP